MVLVLLAEDMQILRDTLVAVLALEDDLEVVGEVSTGDAVVSAATILRPDVAIVDIDLPGMDGLAAAAALREHLPECRVLILTALALPANLRRAMTVHVAGFLGKDVPSHELIAAVRRVAAGERVIDPRLAVAALELAPSPLSPRETEILARYADGRSAAEISAELHLSYGTVRNYLASAPQNSVPATGSTPSAGRRSRAGCPDSPPLIRTMVLIGGGGGRRTGSARAAGPARSRRRGDARPSGRGCRRPGCCRTRTATWPP
jgi:two-component system response regulator DesR